MGDRYMKTQKIMPAGAVAGLSGLMVLFYGYKVFLSGDVGASAIRDKTGGEYENKYVKHD